VNDSYFIPTLKTGDVLVELSGEVWMVTKALETITDGSAYNPVQVANIS